MTLDHLEGCDAPPDCGGMRSCGKEGKLLRMLRSVDLPQYPSDFWYSRALFVM